MLLFFPLALQPLSLLKSLVDESKPAPMIAGYLDNVSLLASTGVREAVSVLYSRRGTAGGAPSSSDDSSVGTVELTQQAKD